MPASGRPPVPARRNARYTPIAVDGPLPREMVAAVPAIRRDPLAYLERLVERYGDAVAFPMPGRPALLVNTPAAARHVLVTRRAVWGKDTAQYGALSAVTGQGLLTSDGDAWRRRRRLTQPAFHHGALHGVAEQAVEAARRAGARIPARGGVVDVDALFLQVTLEVVGRSLFGDDVARDGERLVRAVLQALDVVIRRVRSPLPVPAWAPLPRNRRMRDAVRELDTACEALVRRRRARDAAPQQDLLGLLLAAVDAGAVGERAVRDEIVTTVIAGHETVASCLTWTLHLLAGSPAEQERLHAELDAVLGQREPTWDDVPALRLTRAVVDESLRLYPPAWVLSRRAREDDVVDGVAVPAGTLLVLSPWLLHRRADAFADPRRFDPTRFLGAGPEPGAYVPFGAGARLCIGRDFAIVESVLVLAALLHRWRVGPVTTPDVRVDALVTLRPRGGLPLLLTPR